MQSQYRFLFILLLFLLVIPGFADTLAIPNAVVGEDVPPTVSVPVSDKIAEAIVSSKIFDVLDRAYVEQIMEEQNFQLSGIVSEDEIAQVGAFIGADYVCVSRVTRIEMIYSISSKIIEVETGKVAAQTSAEAAGTTMVIFNLASQVGNKLVASLGGEVPETAVAAGAATTAAATKPAEPAKPVQKPVERTRPATTNTISQPSQKNFSHFNFNYMIPTFGGSSIDALEYDHTGIAYNYDTASYGIDMHLLLDSTEGLYLGLGLGYAWQTIDIPDLDYSEADYSVIDLRLTIGGLLPIGNSLSTYGGIGLTLTGLTLDQYWSDAYGWDSYMESGVGLCFEAGADLFFGDVCLSARMNYTYVPELSTDELFATVEDLEVLGIMLGLGFGL